MNNDTTTSLQLPEDAAKDVLAEILRDGARKMLGEAIEAEAASYIAAHAHERDTDGHRLVVRNGYAPEPELQTGLGGLAVKQPCVNDKRVDDAGNRFRFTSQILPPYLRKTKSIEELIPWLYLRGISTGDFSQAWRMLSVTARSIVFIATLMHDIAKPACTAQENDGRITSRGHSRKGSQLVRLLLWRDKDIPLAVREQVVALIRHHGLPLHFMDNDNSDYAVIEVSQRVRCDWLALLADADVRGREYANEAELVERVSLFRDFAAEHDCLDRSRVFANDHSRVVYFNRARKDPDREVYDDTNQEVVLMSGLPGAGKDHWIATHVPNMPVISLDTLRRELHVRPEGNQAPVVNAAKTRAREYLRHNTSFVWNATNTTRAMRKQLTDLFLGYRARVQIVYLETSWQGMSDRNVQRENPVSARIVEKLARRLDFPDLTEAHRVQWSVT